MKSFISSSRLSTAFFVSAGYLGLAVVLAALGAQTIFTAPGSFLFSRFLLAALYIPLIFSIAALLLRRSQSMLPKRTMLLLWISPILFLTFAVFLQVLSQNISVLASRVLIDTFGRFPASALLLLMIALEIAGMVKLALLYTDVDDALFHPVDLSRAAIQRFREWGFEHNDSHDVAAGFDEPTLEDRPPMAYPSFPDIPEPIEEALYQPPLASYAPAPEKPLSPLSPESDPEVSDLIRRVLTGDSERQWAYHDSSGDPVSDNVMPEPAPFHSAFPTPEDLTPAPGDRMEDDCPDEAGEALDPAFAFLAGETSEDISDKLDPQGTSAIGVIADNPPKPKSSGRRRKYEVPVAGVLADYPDADFASIDESTRKAAEVLEQTLKEFKIEAKVTGIRKGPVITMFELLPSPGVKISRIVNLQDNIALRLAASRVRIVAPIPGKHAVGIEVPNKKRAIVSFSSLVESEEFQDSDASIPVILGKDISGGSQVIDLTRTPHLLIAGATGSGKSVCVNSLIGSILYSRTPQQVKMIMVDPKIVELKLYNDIPHLLTPVITEPKRAIQALQWCLYEMERRYSLLDSQGVRDIKTFNKRVKDRKLATEPLPYIVVVVDEFADLMVTSGKELEGIVARLAAMSRAIGIHLVLATQRPSVDVITGLIKANFPSRIAFMVAGKTDSRIIIDTMGAEKLLGRGDMLFTSAWDPFPSRMQGAFLAEEEVERLSDFVKTLGEPDYIDEEMFVDDDEEEEFHLESSSGDDPMYEKALEIVVSSRKASASYIQRRLKVGYNRAARLVEEMERRGIVGPPNGSKPRDLIHVPERFSGASAVDNRSGTREPSSA